MATGIKTGGRTKGTLNKATIARADHPGAAPPPTKLPPRERAHARLGESGTQFPSYRLAKVDSLIPYANNARTHSAEQISLIAALITEYGFTNPVLVDGKRGVIAGHGRVLAAKKLGMDVVPTIELSHLNAAQRRAYVIADNQSALQAGWDQELLLGELTDLKDLGFDLELTGFDSAELDSLFASGDKGLTEPDDVPEVQAEVVSRLGDVWVLGRHRLLCGSAASERDHDLLLAGAKIDAVACDPPYGVGIEYGEFVDTPDNVRELIAGFMPLVLRWPVVAISTGNERLWDYPRPTWLLGWALSRATGVGPWGFVCYHAVPVWGKDPYLKERKGSRPDTAVELSADRDGVKGHPTVKPVAWWKWLLERVTTKPGRSVFDPFTGSGTTLIAAETTGRIGFGIELDSRYVDVAVRRWQSFTGQSATLDGDGRTFAATELERLGSISTEPLTHPAPRKRRAA